MADLDPAHVEAVARVMCKQGDLDRAHCLTHEDWSISFDGQTCRTGREASERVLTDPAVHAALLAALVRAGVLDVEPWRVKCTCGKRLEGSPDEVEAWIREHDDSPLSKHRIVWNPPSPRPWKRRYVTRWEATP